MFYTKNCYRDRYYFFRFLINKNNSRLVELRIEQTTTEVRIIEIEIVKSHFWKWISYCLLKWKWIALNFQRHPSFQSPPILSCPSIVYLPNPFRISYQQDLVFPCILHTYADWSRKCIADFKETGSRKLTATWCFRKQHRRRPLTLLWQGVSIRIAINRKEFTTWVILAWL